MAGAAVIRGFGAQDAEGNPKPRASEAQYFLHGAIDLVERHAATGHARVTDVKTGTNFAKPGLVIGGGEVLQPVLYGLAYEAVWKERVEDASLSFCTARGGYAEHVIELDEAARAKAVVVLELVDDAIDKGFFPPAPRPGACDTCGYRLVCGPARGEARGAEGRNIARRWRALFALASAPR